MGQALVHGRKKDTMRMTRERERGSERRRTTGREREDGHRDRRRPEPRGTSAGLRCLSTFGRQMTSGLTCDMLSWKTKKRRRDDKALIVGTKYYLTLCIFAQFMYFCDNHKSHDYHQHLHVAGFLDAGKLVKNRQLTPFLLPADTFCFWCVTLDVTNVSENREP